MYAIRDVDLATYCGRLGNLYSRHGLCPPFALYDAARGWIAQDIPLWHCLNVVESFLRRHASSCYSGSGDWNFAWLNSLIHRTWYDRSFAAPPRSSPKDARRRDSPNEYAAEESYEKPDRAAAFNAAPHDVDFKPDRFEPDRIAPRKKAAGAFLPARDAKSTSPQYIRQPNRSASKSSGQVPGGSPKKIDAAVAWLRAELADGERAAVEVESDAVCAGIAPRTYDRARKRLGITSRGIGFGRCAKYMIALPGIDGTPNPSSADAGAI